MSTRTSLRERGEDMRQRPFGDDDGAPAILRTLNTEVSYGAIWSRPGLALVDRVPPRQPRRVGAWPLATWALT